MNFLFFQLKRRAGQTLVETVAAIFILAMGISSALGLAVYANSTSTSITKQIIATGLAREGAEAVKNMRDTNWLKQTAINRDCYNFATTTPPSSLPPAPNCPENSSSAACCYRNWINYPACGGQTAADGFCLDPNPGGPGKLIYRLQSDGTSGNKLWLLEASPAGPNPYLLNLYSDNDWSSANFNGLYRPAAGVSYKPSEYSRQIVLLTTNKTEDAESSGQNHDFPFDKWNDIGPQLEIISRVWWTDKKCPQSAAWPGLGKCSVEIRAFLTNWKNY